MCDSDGMLPKGSNKNLSYIIVGDNKMGRTKDVLCFVVSLISLFVSLFVSFRGSGQS